jgi:glycosyltransferase involved in cell wall biosynthesis
MHNGIKIHRFFTVTGYRESLFKKLLNYFSFALTGTIAGLFLIPKTDRIFIYQTGPLTQALPAAVWSGLFGKPVYIWTQDVWPDSVYAYGFKRTKTLQLFLSALVRFIYKPCRHIFISCKGFESRIRPYCGNTPIEYAPNWSLADFSRGRNTCKMPKGFNFLFAGNIGKVQNLDSIVKAFGKAVFKKPDIFLNIAGDGSYLPELKELVAKENIKNVVFLGRRPVSQMADLFAESGSLVISLKDSPLFELTVPSKFQAYLTAEKPILCAMKGEVETMVSESGTGFCAKPGDLNAIADLFIRISSLTEYETTVIAENARNYYNANFREESIAARLTARITEGI